MSVTPFPNVRACRWCGREHMGEWCPLIESIDYDPDNGCITHIEFRDLREDDEAPTA